MRETTWLSESKEKIREAATHLMRTDKSDYVDFSIPRILKTNVRVYATSDLYLTYLSNNFPTQETLEETPSITLYYDRNSTDSLKALRTDLPLITTPCIGLFEEVSNTGLITGLDEYGLLTSTVIGMHSRLLFANKWNPIHGAVINLAGRGAVLIGHHGAGKSTALLNIIHHAKDKSKIRVLTDDWSVARQEGSSITVHSIEQKMSFSEKLVRENPELDLMTLYEQNALGGIGKLWIDIDKVLGSGTSIQDTTLRKLLVFSPNQDEELITRIPISTVAELLVDSSYHMPDTGQGFKTRQLTFWNDVLTNIDFAQINSRFNRMPKDEIYGRILDYIME
jgi:hypothetical protein